MQKDDEVGVVVGREGGRFSLSFMHVRRLQAVDPSYPYTAGMGRLKKRC